MKAKMTRRHEWRKFSYMIIISHILIANLFLYIAMYPNYYDLSLAFAFAFSSILIIILIIYNWKKDSELFSPSNVSEDEENSKEEINNDSQ